MTHAPWTDAVVDALEQSARAHATTTVFATEMLVCVAEIREARRLLRAVEWIRAFGDIAICPSCKRMKPIHQEGCELGRYLAACEGKREER